MIQQISRFNPDTFNRTGVICDSWCLPDDAVDLTFKRLVSDSQVTDHTDYKGVSIAGKHL